MTRVQRHALTGAMLVAVFLAGLITPSSQGFGVLGPHPLPQILGFLLAGTAVGALVGLAEWVAQIALLAALSAKARGEAPPELFGGGDDPS